MPAEHDPTPMGTPVPAGECPHCHAFFWVRMLKRPPRAPVAAPPGQPVPCNACPHCKKPIWTEMVGRPALAPPKDAAATALVPKRSKDRREATTRQLRRPG